MDTPKKLVLTIEDQPAIADLLVFLLDASELEVKRSDNGAEGLAMVKELKPDLVIMDVMMPILDGWQVFDAVRQDETTQNIPIIMLSVARQDPERRTAFRGSHLDFYMTKPFDVAALRRMVEEVLGLEIWTKASTPPIAPSPTIENQPAILSIEPSLAIESQPTSTPPSSATSELPSTSPSPVLKAIPPSPATPEPSNTPNPPILSTSPVLTTDSLTSLPAPEPSVLPVSSEPSVPPAPSTSPDSSTSPTESPALPTPPITTNPPSATEPSPSPQVKE